MKWGSGTSDAWRRRKKVDATHSDRVHILHGFMIGVGQVVSLSSHARHRKFTWTTNLS